MDARPRISLGAAPPPSLISSTTDSSSGSFPIRAPPTPDDDEPSDLDSYFPSSSCSDIYSNSSSYNGFESGEDYETPPLSEKHEDGSDKNLFSRPFVAESDPEEDYEISEDYVDKNLFLRPFVGDEIVEDGVGVVNNRFLRQFVGDADNEIVEDNDFVDKDHFFRPFVVDSDDQVVEDDAGIDKSRLFRPFVAVPYKEMEQDYACVYKDGFFRPFVVVPDDEIIDDVVGADKNLVFRPFFADPDKETMEEDGYVDEGGVFCYAAETDEDSSVTETDGIFPNFNIKAKDNSDPDRFVSMPIARLSLEFDDETEFSIIEDFGGATVEGQEKAESCSVSIQQFDPLGMGSNEQSAEKYANESSIKTMGGSALETGSCSVSIPQFDTAGMDSGEQSAGKDANETTFLYEPVTENAAIDYNTEKSAKPILDEDAEPTETASQENEIDDFYQLEPFEEQEVNSSSFFNFTPLNPDSGPIPEEPVFDMNVVDIGHEEKELYSAERTNLENLLLLKVQFLRFIHKLGFSAEDPTAAHVLNLLNSAAQPPSFQHIAIDINAIEGKSLDFSLHILVLGKSGVGKSSTVNSIFQEQKVEIDPFEPATRTVKEVFGTLKNGIKVRILDTPGLRQSSKEQGFNRKTLASVKKLLAKFRVDAILYVDRLDSYDDSYNDLPLLQTITDSLGASIWRQVVFVYTHATVEVSPLSYAEFVRQRHNVIQRCICVVNPPDTIIQPILLIENNDCCEKSQDQMLLLCCSMKTVNEACSSSGDRQWRGDSQVVVDARFRAGRGFVIGLDVKRRNWKITVGASLP